MKQTMQVSISFLKTEIGSVSAVDRKEPTTLTVTRFQPENMQDEPRGEEMRYVLEVDGKAMLELDGAEFSRMLNACGVGTW